MSFASLELSTTTPFALSLSKGLFACYQPLSLRYRRPVSFVPLRVLGSSACRRVRRVVAPAGESLSFVASNESNQSKDALHLGVTLRLQGFGRSTPCHSERPHTCCDLISTHLAAHRCRGAERRGQGKFAKQTTVLLLGPVGGVEERRGLGPRAQARFVH